jgi:uncharacterized surface protein with fasciclin (FAS1) repeats
MSYTGLPRGAPITAASVHELIASALAAAQAPPPLDVTASLSALVQNNTPNASSKASSAAILSKMSAKMPEASAFLKLLSHTPVAEAVGSAPVTIFAPSNAAMKLMPNDFNTTLAKASFAEHRDLFARQHMVIADSEASASSSAAGGAPGFPTANPAKSIMYESGSEATSSSSLAAALYNNSYEQVASANILETYTDHASGTTVHVMSSALLD